MTKISGSGSESGSISQRHGSTDPDPHQKNVMDPERWFQKYIQKNLIQRSSPQQAGGAGDRPAAAP